MRIALNKICMPTDFSDNATNALRYALTLAEKFSAELHLLHVVEDIVPAVPEPGLAILPTQDILRSLEKGANEALDKMVSEEWTQKVKVIRAVRHGLPFHEITRYAKKETVDLLVLSTHGRTGLAHLLLGSVAERVVRTSPCPVLTIRHPEHEFILPD